MSQAKGTIVLTGANGGLGHAIVAQIATGQFATYYGIYAVRNAALPSPSLDAALEHSSSSHDYEKVSLDLSQFGNVRETAAIINARVKAKEIPPISALILNAGYEEFETQTWTDDGLDKTFAVNYLGHWLLTLLLLQSMDQQTGRVIWISSWSHNPADSHNAINGAYTKKYVPMIRGDDLEPIAKGTWSANKDDTSVFAAGYRRYGVSKLCGVTMIHELQRRLDQDPLLKNISVLAIDPGAMSSGIARRSDLWFVRVFIFQIMIPFFAFLFLRFFPNGTWRTLEKSAGDVVSAALECGPHPLTERPKGLFLNGSELGSYNPEAKDPRTGEIIWQGSVRYSNLKNGETVLQEWT